MKNENIILVVLEAHMEHTFFVIEAMLKKKKIAYSKVYAHATNNNSIFWRLFNYKKYFNSLNSFMNIEMKYEKSLLIFCVGEGFEISNLNNWLPDDLKKARKIALQHGMFYLNNKWHRKLKLFLVKNINFITRLFFNFNISGLGFGGVKFDYYVVYGNKYKNYLLKKQKWNRKNILVSGSILKPIQNNIQINKIGGGNCLLLLANFVEVKLLSKQKYINYLKLIVTALNKRYKNVLVRPHPKMDLSILKNVGDVEITTTKSINEDFTDKEVVFSFYSSGLIDAALIGLPVIGIIIPEVNYRYYDFINKKIDIAEFDLILNNLIDYSECFINKDEIYTGDNTKQIFIKMFNK
jgi:hypothetical protein